MGRSRGTKNDHASEPAPGRGVRPSILDDIQEIGGMSPAWHRRNHLVQEALGEVLGALPVNDLPLVAATSGNIKEALYLLLWHSRDKTGDPVTLEDNITLLQNHRHLCDKAATALLQTKGLEVLAAYKRWQEENPELIERLLQAAAPEKITAIWFAVAAKPYDRFYTALNLQPMILRDLQIPDELKKEFELSVPSIRLVLQGKEGNDPALYTWRVERGNPPAREKSSGK